jgi:hypothetical protein
MLLNEAAQVQDILLANLREAKAPHPGVRGRAGGCCVA